MKKTKALHKLLPIICTVIIATAIMIAAQLSAGAATIGSVEGLTDFGEVGAGETGNYDGYEYEIVDIDEDAPVAYITGYTGNEKVLRMPDKINGYIVYGIDEYAFEGNTQLERVVIPSKCVVIGHCAFLDCTNLKSISASPINSLLFVCECSFDNTLWYYDEDNWTDDVLYFMNIAIKCNKEVTSVELKQNTKAIGEYAFADCPNLTSVDMDACSTELLFIAPGAFMDSPKLKSIALPDSVELIGDYAFGFTYDWDNDSAQKVSGFKVCGSSYSLAKDYAEYYGFTYECTNPLKLNKSSITLGFGEIYDLESNDSVKAYSSSNTSVATVDMFGTIRTNGTGSATITAVTNDGRRATCKVTVKKAPTSMSLNKNLLILSVGEQFDLDSSLPSGQGAYSISYSSNNSKVADVKESGGIVTAKSTGKAKITATAYNGVKAECTVYVNSGAKQGESINLKAKTGNTADTYKKTFKGVDVISVPGHTFSVYKWDEWKTTKSDYVDGYISSRVVKNSDGSYTLYLWSRATSGTGTIKAVYKSGEVYNYKYTVAKQGESIVLNAKNGGKADTYSKTFKNVKTISVPGHTFSVYKWDEWKTTKSDYVEGYISSRVVKNSDGSYTLYLWSRASLGTGVIEAVYKNGEIYNYQYTVEGLGESITLGAKSNGKADTYSKTFKNVKTITVPGHTFSVYKWDEWKTTKSDYVDGYISSRVAKNSDGSYTLYLWSRASAGTGAIKVLYNNGETYNHKYTVEPAPTGVKLSEASLSLKIGETFTISSATQNTNSYVWTSSDSAVATVTKNGTGNAEIKAVGAGSAEITVTAYNGASASCTVTVSPDDNEL